MMGILFRVFSAFVIGIGTSQFLVVLANDNSSKPGSEDEVENDDYYSPIPLSMAWIEKPPYTTSPTNGSIDDGFHGLIRDALLRYISFDCGLAIMIAYIPQAVQAYSEFGMIELLRQNRVHFAAPIFEPINRQYGEFVFFKLADYPGTDFITTDEETNKLKVVLHAVLKSWPLFAVTLIITAIAGIIVWALVGWNLYTETYFLMINGPNQQRIKGLSPLGQTQEVQIYTRLLDLL